MISLSRLQTFYSDFEPEALIRVMVKEEFNGKIALFSSFGAYSSLLIDMVAKIDPDIPVLFLDTGKHFTETLNYVEEVKKKTGITNLKVLYPDPKLLLNADPNGDLWKTQVNRCCWVRKVEPLTRAMDEGGYKAVITGRKRYQTSERKDLQKVDLDEDNRFRINPLAYWSKEQIIDEFEKRDLPQHPLVEKGYPSIGCEPCTFPVKQGEDERSGRWKHTINLQGKQKAECGIHLQPSEITDWEV